MRQLDKLRSGQTPSQRQYNELVDRINMLSRPQGRNGITISSSPTGITYIGTPSEVSSAVPIYKAYIKTDAGSGDTIDCYLDTDSSDEEITATCAIAGGSALNTALPRLEDGDIIYVTPDSTVGEGSSGEWRSVMTFHESTGIRKAFAKDDASTGTTIDCYLDTDATGDKITVTCELTGGSDLNSAIPRLVDGDMIYIAPDSSLEGSTSAWRSVMTFQASQDCA